jgi:hypothetical protein
MTQYKANEQCVIGMPSCGYGFNSSKLCFIARPADGEFQLEEDILRQLLTDKNYDTYVAVQRIDPGKLVFCTKICSKIITSQFCIVLLNPSIHREHPSIKIPNPNVHLEYGMMLSFHKHVIPMQRESEQLAFNIYPIDTVKYSPQDFTKKAEGAIEDAIIRFKTKEPPGRPIGTASDVYKYFSIQGLRFTDTSTDQVALAIFNLGAQYGFNLFNSVNEIVFFGFFHEEEPLEILFRTRFLLNNIDIAFRLSQQNPDETFRQKAQKVHDQLRIELLVPETAPIETLFNKIDEHQSAIRSIPLKLLTPSQVEGIVKAEYDKATF